MKKGNYYLTTPIYYPSGKLHIGHTYTTVAADVLARFKRFTGYDVMFLTGTDEHGEKIQVSAKEKGKDAQKYVDEMVEEIKLEWEKLDISYDEFIRTTDEKHKKAVQKIFETLYEKGDIYKSEYEGCYCIPCESFWTEKQLKENKACPDCNRPAHLTKEEAYFFKLSKYQERLLKEFEENPKICYPTSRKNEMVNNFLKPGLDDLCVSRTSFDWGIKVPFDTKHVIYVWFDAVCNYITALGFASDNTDLYKKYWPADVHLIGKEIVRFHTLVWPAMLMALDIPLPKMIFGHGWILFDSDKMSKSKGNVVYPKPIIDRYGIDALKYFLLKEFTFGQDGNYTNRAFVTRLNTDLANDLGNLVSRSIAMIVKYNQATIPSTKEEREFDNDLRRVATEASEKVENAINNLDFSGALEEIWKIVRRSNKYIDETTPWVLAKDEKKKERLDTVLFNLADCIRIISILINPFMKNTSEEICRQLGIGEENIQWEKTFKRDETLVGNIVTKGKILFPRLEIDKELLELEKANDKYVETIVARRSCTT